jgi:diguanylate cyclase (GGDEF)-like protein/PAS domain S-box-containing protein
MVPARLESDAATVSLTRNAGAVITFVDDGITDMLGWTPEQLVGCPSTQFIHPEDQPSAIAAWMEMITEPGSVKVWRGRYRGADGSWCWVETINENRLETEDEVVRTTIRRAAGEHLGIEEELRVRTELLTRLSDALPVGLVQITADRAITFTNDRLRTIIDAASAATIDELFAGVIEDDRPHLTQALAAVLADEPVDDIELRLDRPVHRVCLLSLRALTGRDGRVSGAIGCLSDITERADLRRELEIRATVDTLTSCLNRAATLELLRLAVAKHAGTDHGTAVVFVDLDRFKDVNDTLGHAAGDELLITVASRLKAAVRTGDEVGRIGGDEFLVICPAIESDARADDLKRRLVDAVQRPATIGDVEIDVAASFGVAWCADPVDPDALVAAADRAMYESKRATTTPSCAGAGVGGGHGRRPA